MSLPDFLTLPYWNHLGRAHLPELIMILTAAVVVLLDRHLRKLIHQFTSSHGPVFRFVVFVLTCSVGYGALALGSAWALRLGLTMYRGAYLAPMVAGILLVVAIEAQRQKQS